MVNIRLAMSGMNPTVGDIKGNGARITAIIRKARESRADLVLLPELVVTGYPPEDLLLKPGFIADNLREVERICKKVSGITAIVGFVDREGKDVFNAAAIMHEGRIEAVYRKMYLPNYGVFDEQRYFRPGREALNVRFKGVAVGIGICEDIWYEAGPAKASASAGAGLIVNINASPFYAGKDRVREDMLRKRALDNGAVVAYCNMTGGQDELVFDGRGMIIDKNGALIAKAKAFEEDLLVADLEIDERPRRAVKGLREAVLPKARAGAVVRKPLPARKVVPGLEGGEEVLGALVLGTRDYVRKNGFERAVIGISGGIDSALVASVAVMALGNENVIGVFMPSEYTSGESSVDAVAIAMNLGMEFLEISIQETNSSYLRTLKDAFKGRPADITEENIQARTRGNILMALSNKFGWLVLTTGNKSEMSVGYATLYGDMAGGFAVIKDVPKTMVYELSGLVNKRLGKEAIPGRVFTKAPTAELKFNQTDQDTLPPYDVLDAILKAYVEDDMSLAEMVRSGFPASIVKRVVAMVDGSEYKRRQAPPGIKITPRAFGKDRRMPITNGYRE